MAEIARLADTFRAHLVLIAGDVFDTENPPARAEELYYRALCLLAREGRHVVVIAGNHDQPERLAAAAPLAARHRIHVLGRPRAEPPSGPGVLASGPSYLHLRGPDWPYTAAVLALPYPSEARLGAPPAAWAAREGEQQEAYAGLVGALWRELAAGCLPGAVNLAVSHLYVRGGLTSASERFLSVGGAYAVDPGAFPSGLQYIALGHLHRPQEVRGACAPCRYSGSPLAYSFSEAGQAKSVVLVEAAPGLPARCEEAVLDAGRPLACWRATGGFAEALAWCREGRDPAAWIDLEVHSPAPLTREQENALRELRPEIVNLRVVLTGSPGAAGARAVDYASLPLDELFARFYRRQTGGGEPDPELVGVFLELAGAAEGEEAPDATG